ncbi:MAG: hypothetical protein AAB565_02325 [Patescibacteria group bacterium]
MEKANQNKLTPLVIFLVLGATILYFANALSQKEELAKNTKNESLLPPLVSETLAARFDYLSKETTNACGGGKDYVAQLSSDGKRLQGSCCNLMDFHSYQEQIEGLKKYAEYEIIPSDPYNIEASFADRMIVYNDQTKLTVEQQAVYDKAVELSMEEGPCCCKCWHWYSYEGLAKYLIINEGFSAEQIAEIWDLSDACGGEHHHH